MKNEKEVSGKYLFNLKEKKKSNSISGNNDIKKKEIEFYDDIEKTNIKISDIKKQLNRIKSATIKECVYSNHFIPSQWKTKLDYQNNILKLFSKDENFLTYVGKGNSCDNNNNNNNFDFNNINNYNNDNEINEFYETKSTMYKTDNSFYNKKKKNEDQKVKKILFKKKILLPEEEKDNLRSKFIYPNQRRKYYSYTDKEVLSILEDYRNSFPLKEKMNSLILLNKEREKLKQEKFSKTYSNNLFNTTNNININKINNNNLENLYKMIKSQRLEAFRQNIFNKIIPKNFKPQSTRNKKIKKKIKFEENTFGPFLNSNSESFNKKIEINNPIVNKYLEKVNFYGPYYSYCPPCRNNNMEFYKKMSQENAIDLLQFIRKNKDRKEINFKKIKHKLNDKMQNKSPQSKNFFNSYSNNINNNDDGNSNTFISNSSRNNELLFI